jgi:hypothetical protein
MNLTLIACISCRILELTKFKQNCGNLRNTCSNLSIYCFDIAFYFLNHRKDEQRGDVELRDAVATASNENRRPAHGGNTQSNTGMA